MPKLLFILSSHSELGNTGKKTGYWLSELAHPYHELQKSCQIDFATPNGGSPPLDPGSVAASNDEVSIAFAADKEIQSKLANSLCLQDVKASDYDGVVYPGGHSPMWGLANNKESHDIARDIYENGGVVAAVCHGPAALVNVKLTNGAYLVAGKKVTAFTNTEEDAVGLTAVVPFLLEDHMKNNGAVFERAADWNVHVCVDGNLVTAQNPASAAQMGKAVLEILSRKV